MATTPENITDEQIKQLSREAAEAGDLEQIAICSRALRQSPTCELYEYEGAPVPPFATVEEARAECARVVADAEAQQNA